MAWPLVAGLLLGLPLGWGAETEPLSTAPPDVAVDAVPAPEPPPQITLSPVMLPFNRQWLIDYARQLATQEFQPRVIAEQSPLRQMSYDEYRAIVFNPNAAIWKGLGLNFTAELFHPGFIFNNPVLVNLVQEGIARRIDFSTDLFMFGERAKQYQGALAEGYSGLRLRYPLNSVDISSEFLVFQGASYLRSLGRDQFYGLSARGLALNTARPQGEEFPFFSEFWIEQPGSAAQEIVVHALLDSPSVTGAYTFRARPGATTTMDVEVALFARREAAHYGLAPLTSMFLLDATNHSRFDDYRPAVHDSDGLSIWNASGEKLWRPLANPRTLQISAFLGASPRGFGLMQRASAFSDFEDNEARYEKRPSLWIEPLGQWGAGHVELVEIPTDEEVNDNIVAYWQPQEPLRVDQPLSFSYRMHWGRDLPETSLEGVIVATRQGAVPRANRVSDTERVFTVDFQAAEFPDDLTVKVSASRGAVTDARGEYLAQRGVYRVYLKFDPQQESVAELRMTLTHADKQWGETWLYRWTR
ncbi:MAG: glucan biosynthesis protein G [Pseudomonadales bacterium]|jgi:glucans biosynthesis protein|nr:glucan biosynthesis protein G [Pseudomonadales bacterium]